ncbi:SDR family oxidoreductase [Alteromonadaceae bacterium M269]|nr:SDR family oxidoreductase [Alteromonadaceae bacterium M269]
MTTTKHILITGANGYIGRLLGQHLSKDETCKVIGIDISSPSSALSFPIEQMDIRSNDLTQFVAKHQITHIVHLASIVSPGKDEALEYDIDVNGTKNVIQACLNNHVQHLTVTSSGAAYGYHADNPEWISESDPLRGNEAFSYSRHKRLVEQALESFTQTQGTTQVLVLRPCTVLGATTQNKITALFDRKRILAVGSSNSPFVFIWDNDLVHALAFGALNSKSGAYNLAGDGKLTVQQLAAIMKKPVQRVPAFVLKLALWVGYKLGLASAKPEQVMFLQYRPVLSNKKLKSEFGYQPQKTTKEVFELFWRHRQQQSQTND